MQMVIVNIFVFLIGACWGSFLNCLVCRWEQGKRLNRGRSFCPKCKHQLGLWDLIPVLSFVFLKRKCRYCRKNISWQYLAVEIATGLVFLLIFNFCLISQLILVVFTISCLIVIFIYDLRHYIIPDQAIYPAIGAVFLYRIFEVLNFGFVSDLGFRISDLRPLCSFFIAGVSSAAFFFIIWFVSRGRWMGFGDVKLVFLMGLFLGFPNILVALFAAFWIGAIVGIALLIMGRKKMKSQVPFGPFLVIGTFIALFWGEKIIQWYLNLLG